MVIITIIGSIIIEIIMTDLITITEMVEMTDSIIEDLQMKKELRKTLKI